MSMAFLL